MTLIFILVIALVMGSIIQAALDYKQAADMYLEWNRAQIKRNDWLLHSLEAAENDMRRMPDCCDVCRHNLGVINPDCPCECSECAAEACICRACKNGSHFAWRGIQETERRSGNGTGGETQDGGGDCKEPPETVFTAQTGA